MVDRKIAPEIGAETSNDFLICELWLIVMAIPIALLEATIDFLM